MLKEDIRRYLKRFIDLISKGSVYEGVLDSA